MQKIAVALCLLLSSQLCYGASVFMLPQPKPFTGPWFEGWYIRVTDPLLQRSFATITTSSTSDSTPLAGLTSLPGYVALLYSLDSNSGTHSEEFFPLSTTVVLQDENQFTWEAPGFGQLSDQGVMLSLPSGDRMEVQLSGEREPWSDHSQIWGPDAWLDLFKLFPLHWYVDSVGTPVHYKLTLGKTGQTVEGDGFAEVEKNWGRVFPQAWMWAEAISPDNSAHLGLAGGPLDLGPVDVTSYLVGYKTQDLDIQIRPEQVVTTKFLTQIDSCSGEFTLIAEDLLHRLVIRVKASPSSFAPVSIPTGDGYAKNRGKESFVADMEVEVYVLGLWVETRKFHGAAIEFGAANMKCPAPPQ